MTLTSGSYCLFDSSICISAPISSFSSVSSSLFPPPSTQLSSHGRTSTAVSNRFGCGCLSHRKCCDTTRRRRVIVCGLLPVDPWAPTIDSQSIASQLFAFSLFPYLGFLYYMTKSKSAPRLTLFGFYFLLAFVGATIPAGIYSKVHYGTSLSNVDWLHGGAESLLTLTNLFIVLGLRQVLKKSDDIK